MYTLSKPEMLAIVKKSLLIYLWLIHADVWQKPTQYCKAITLQLKINLKNELIYKTEVKTLTGKIHAPLCS